MVVVVVVVVVVVGRWVWRRREEALQDLQEAGPLEARGVQEAGALVQRREAIEGGRDLLRLVEGKLQAQLAQSR